MATCPYWTENTTLPQVIEINEAGDDRLKVYANLRGTDHGSAQSNCFIVEGRWCVQRLLESNHTIESVLVARGKELEFASRLKDGTPLYSLPQDEIRKLVGFDFHRGVLACGQRPVLKDFSEFQLRSCVPPVALAALGVSEHENLGSMIRTASALGIEHVLVGLQTVDPFYRRSIRVSMATVFKQNLYQLRQPDLELRDLEQTQNLRTVVTTLDPDATPLDEFQRDDRGMILVVGNEAAGVDQRVQEVATDRVTIPMMGTDSLNVSVAAAIFMHELVRRHPSRTD